MTALVRVAWTPGRGEPSHRSEMVTQWLCGERLEVRDEGEDGWLRVTGPDGYACWLDGGGLLRMEAGEADRWEEEADRVSLGTELRPAGGDDGAGGGGGSAPGVPSFLPWGARLAAPRASGDAPGEGARVRLPDGRTADVDDPDRLVAREECVLRFPPRPDALLASATGWIGVPYLWGGRTRQGADCSGYVQAVLALHGRRLPRDSGLQVRADEPVWQAEGGDADAMAVVREVARPGDLLFFGERGEFGHDGESGAAGGFGGDADPITHVAFCAEASDVLHAAAGRGQVARDDLASDDPLMARLRGRLVAVTRPLGRDPGREG